MYTHLFTYIYTYIGGVNAMYKGLGLALASLTPRVDIHDAYIIMIYILSTRMYVHAFIHIYIYIYREV